MGKENASFPVIVEPPDAPLEYTQLWGSQIVRWLVRNVLLRSADPTPIVAAEIYFPPPGLPTTGYGLAIGSVFDNGGVLTIVRNGDIWLQGSATALSVGTVTVTVT